MCTVHRFIYKKSVDFGILEYFTHKNIFVAIFFLSVKERRKKEKRAKFP